MAYPESLDHEEFQLEAVTFLNRDRLRVTGLFERQAPYEPPAEPFSTRRRPKTVHVLSSSPVSARFDYAGHTTGWSFAAYRAQIEPLNEPEMLWELGDLEVFVVEGERRAA